MPSSTPLPTPAAPPPTLPSETRGLALGLLGVAIFALTLPMTRLAVGTPEAPLMSGLFIAMGRAAVAGLLSALLLIAQRAPLPRRADWGPLALTALGVVFGFPLLSSIAMRHVGAVHASVIVGALPLATAAVGALLHRQRPSRGFWACALLGAALVVGFALLRSGTAGLALHPADLLLLGAVLCAAVGYGYGARLSQHLRADTVICWALVISLPATLPLGLLSWPAAPVPASAWAAFGYVACFRCGWAFCLVPGPGAGRHGAREPGATGAALSGHAVCRAAAGRAPGRCEPGLRPGSDGYRFGRKAHARAWQTLNPIFPRQG
jgi:drug/metabolite transporter (DMT)-like permease